MAVYVFGVLPLLEHNSATALDAFGLWPAAMIALIVTALVGVTLTVARLVTRHRLTTSSDQALKIGVSCRQ